MGAELGTCPRCSPASQLSEWEEASSRENPAAISSCVIWAACTAGLSGGSWGGPC